MLEEILQEVILLLGLYLFLLGILFFCFIVGIIFIIYGAYNKKLKHRKGFIIGGFVLSLPLAIILLFRGITKISEEIKHNNNLSWQIVHGSVDDVSNILKSGISPECFSENKKENILAKEGEKTCIYYLASLKNIDEPIEKLKLLIDYGGNVNCIVFNCDKTPEEHIYLGYNDGCGTTPLMKACEVGNIEMVKILLENGANINAREFSGRTALHHAVFYDSFETSEETQIEIIKLLLENGIDKNIEGYYHGTALDCAKEYQLENFIEILK